MKRIEMPAPAFRALTPGRRLAAAVRARLATASAGRGQAPGVRDRRAGRRPAEKHQGGPTAGYATRDGVRWRGSTKAERGRIAREYS
jgi:hypothetical protein